MTTVNERILEAQIRHSIYLERYKAGVLRQIIALLNRTEADLIEQIAARLAKIEGRGYDLGKDSTQRLNDLLKAIKERRESVYQVLERQLSGELIDFASYEADFQIKTAASAGAGVQMTLPSNPQLKAIVTAQPFQGRLLKDWVKDLSQSEIRRVSDAIKIGITEGQTTDQIVRRIRGSSASRYQDGILEISRRNAESVVRTAIAHTQARAKMELYEANSDIIEGVMYVSVLDSRTTLLCASRDGNVYQINKAPPIPAHWGCRSTYVPYFGELETQGTRASQFGQVPSKMTYEQFLRKQSVDFQNDVLGVERAKQFRAGAKLDRFIDKSGKVYTLKQLAQREKS